VRYQIGVSAMPSGDGCAVDRERVAKRPALSSATSGRPFMFLFTQRSCGPQARVRSGWAMRSSGDSLALHAEPVEPLRGYELTLVPQGWVERYDSSDLTYGGHDREWQGFADRSR
jgi:hypothetical protein